MLGLTRPDTLWLISVNILLGLAIIMCSVLIAMNFLKEIKKRKRQKSDQSKVPDDYLNGLKDLGVTMPDGGEKIDEMDEA